MVETITLIQIALWIATYITMGVMVGKKFKKMGALETSINSLDKRFTEKDKLIVMKIALITITFLWPISALATIAAGLKNR